MIQSNTLVRHLRVCVSRIATPTQQKLGGAAILLLTAALSCGAESSNSLYRFTTLIDSTQGYTSFTSMPAISNSGAIAFTATGTTYPTGAVVRWQDGVFQVIASKELNGLTEFGDTVGLNGSGTVAFSARVVESRDTIIGTGSGGPVQIIASAAAQGLVGNFALGVSGINESGHVVFLGIRRGFRSQALFEGGGAVLVPVLDTLTDSSFVSFGNAAINSSDAIVFFGDTGLDVGIFVREKGFTRTIAITNSEFTNFIDPVINNNGTVAGGAFLQNNDAIAFTSTGSGLNRFPGQNGPFTNVDNVSIHSSGDIVFLATDINGRDGIFTQGKSKPNILAVIQVGDSLFGSTLSRIALGRYSSNVRGQVVFQFALADGRQGLAIAEPSRTIQ